MKRSRREMERGIKKDLRERITGREKEDYGKKERMKKEKKRRDLYR